VCSIAVRAVERGNPALELWVYPALSVFVEARYGARECADRNAEPQLKFRD
jgi:hypothetical protein